jgi:hypothetical protein
MADFADGAIAIVGDALDKERDAAGAVTFVGDFFELLPFEFARALFDRAVDIIGGHIGGFARIHGGAQARVGFDAGAAQARGDIDFANQARKYLTARGVYFFFFATNRRPFTMSGHEAVEKFKIQNRKKLYSRLWVSRPTTIKKLMCGVGC